MLSSGAHLQEVAMTRCRRKWLAGIALLWACGCSDAPTGVVPVPGEAFAYAGKNYGLRMNPTNHARTNWAVVTCVGVADPNAPATSSCTEWELTPSGTYDGATKNVGYLEEVTSKGATFVGHYLLTFGFVVTR